MATNPNLVKWWPALSEAPTPQETALHIRLLYNGHNDFNQAITTLKGQLDAATGITPATASTTTIVNTSGGSGAIGPVGPPGPPGPGSPSGLGGINNQSGNATYTTAAMDNGILLVTNRGGGTAVTLNSAVSTPFFFFVTNLGATGTATLTSSSGTVNGGGSFALTPLKTSIVAFDGTNWTASVLPVVVDFQTNSVDNTSQSKLNLIQGTNVTITDGGSGNITISASTTTASAYVVRLKTANYTAVADDVIFCDTSGGGFTITLPAATSNSGVTILVKKISSDANTLTIGRTGGNLIDGATAQSTTLPFGSYQFISDGVSNWGIF